MTSSGDGPTSPVAGKNTTAVGFKLQDPPRVLYGWKLHMSMLGLTLALLFSALETTIIATALTTIGTHFNDYTKVGWVVTAYLVTFSGCILTYAKMTDIFGQRNVLLFALAWFALFSGLCAASQSMDLTHLIVFRALQGIGGSGIFSVVFVALVDICPAKLLGPYSAVVSSTFAVASIIGPIMGGAISDTGDWKWIFLLNVPGSAVAGITLFLCFPEDNGRSLDKSVFRRVDIVGSVLSIGSAVMLLYGLQTGGAEHPWNDARIIGTIVAGGLAVVLLFLYEWMLQRKPANAIEPVLPLRLLKNPRVTCLLLLSFFQGCVFYTTVMNLPQLNQIVHLNSATQAGIRILPLMLASSFSSMFSGVALSKTTRFGWWMVFAACSIIVLGVGLLVELPSSEDVLARSYGYGVILGAGLGATTPLVMVLSRVEVEDRDNAVMMGAVNTIRTMGGCIALSACSAILNSEMPGRLASLPEDVVQPLLKSPTSVLPLLDGETALMVRRSYDDVYRLLWIAVTAFAAVQLLFAVPPLFLSSTKSAPKVDASESAADRSDESGEKGVIKDEV